ncbi:ABC transporter permease [Riemerella anatipestifer]|uniref:ABC transporter permease n=1 Tax=Riemerella anatipestifer TaxID=34085 RepID=UPI001C1E6238|nr:ABC transporter permease [Riemerella anatipestifer]MCW0491619.1 ABC transporter permease [Riemerella anatipestifer]MDR7750045.1 ABC transporter permease [Riemerella anatipestifer]MDR7752279.1 ABC transporter permease [Riemerella anatipestifer]MDR7754276.1 ABC transporter permease [Riemerella anatipestifer]MDR7757583.1 ABC transporter permease [Riemerella anatipestifer]
MKNIIIITKREFLTQVKKKSFIVLTLLAPILMIVFGAVIGLMFKANETEYQFSVIDKSGVFENRMKAPQDVSLVYASPNTEASLKEGLKTSEAIDGVLIIPPMQGQDYEALQNQAQLLVNKKIGFDVRKALASSMSEVIKKEKIKALGITETQVNDLDKSFELKTTNVLDNHQQDDSLAFGVKSGLSMLLMYATFMFILIYGVRVMRSVLEEKNNRVVEIIISSVKPFDLMMGKILGVTLVALTQFVIWIGMAVTAAVFFNQSFSPMPNENTLEQMENIQEVVAHISHTLLELNYGLIIGVFLVFFLLGYIFYSSIYAAIGSAVDNDTETQQFTLFVTIPLMLGLYGSISIMNNPDGPMDFWLSMIPLTSPVAMIARIPFGVPIWELVLSVALLFITTLLMVFIAAKIYRVGILMHGNKATLKELWKWIRHS